MKGFTRLDHISVTDLVIRALVCIGREAGLTPVQLERAAEISEGLTYAAIAIRHGITVNTVKSEVAAVLHTLGISCGHEIVDAVRAARLRYLSGAGQREIETFLRMRFE